MTQEWISLLAAQGLAADGSRFGIEADELAAARDQAVVAPLTDMGLIRASGEFVVNLTTAALAFATDWCGVKSGRTENKFQKMGLTPLPAEKIGAPLIAESPVNLECRVREIKPLGSHDLFIAEIVAVHADSRYFNPRTGVFDLAQADPICYSHGKYYHLGREIGKFGFAVEKKKKKKRPS